MLTADQLAARHAAVDLLVAGVLAGHVRSIARALSVVEDGSAGAAEVLAGCRAAGRRAVSVGITGPPGAGKSTLIEALIHHLRGSGRRVGVLAVDPSSPVTGGALLGDRIRMGRHHADPGVFLRSLATRGASGGVPACVGACAEVLSAAGFDVVLLETVGVGQAEVAVANVVQVTVLVLPPGLGDEVQAMKAGVMELADVLAVTKADLDGTERLVADILAAQSLGVGRQPRIVSTVAHTGAGVAELWTEVERCLALPLPGAMEEAVC